MKSFRQIAIVSLVSLAAIGAAIGTANAATYSEVLKACGAEWKASDERKSVVKGEGAKAWQAFRAKCVREKGWNGTKATARTA